MRFSLRLFARATALLSAVLSLLLPCALIAHFDIGGVLSTIRDPRGAPFAHAKVTMTNSATGSSVQTDSGDTGEYDVP